MKLVCYFNGKAEQSSEKGCRLVHNQIKATDQSCVLHTTHTSFGSAHHFQCTPGQLGMPHAACLRRASTRCTWVRSETHRLNNRASWAGSGPQAASLTPPRSNTKIEKGVKHMTFKTQQLEKITIYQHSSSTQKLHKDQNLFC